MRFVETHVFTELLRKGLDDDDYRALQIASETFYMLFLYRKNEQGGLSPAEVRTLARLVREELR